MPPQVFTISEVVDSGRFKRTKIDEILAAHPELGYWTAGGTTRLLRESDIRKAERIRAKGRKPGRPKIKKD